MIPFSIRMPRFPFRPTKRSRPLDPLIPYPVSPWPAAFLLALALGLFTITFHEAKSHAFETSVALLLGAVFFAVYADLSTRRSWKTMLAVRHDELRRLRYRSGWLQLAPEEMPGAVLTLLRSLGYIGGISDRIREGSALSPSIRGVTPDGKLVLVFTFSPREREKGLDGLTLQAIVGAGVSAGAEAVVVVTSTTVSGEADRIANDLSESILRMEIWDLDALAEKARTVLKDSQDLQGLLPWSQADEGGAAS